MQTLEITNLGGPLTRRNTGDINSGLAKFVTSWGYDPYSKPGNLTWLEQPTSILTWAGSQGPMAIMKQRTEGDVNLVYGVANNANLYRITVNSSSNPNVDSPSIISALAGGFGDSRGAGMVFYGSTEKIFIGDNGTIQRVNFDGSSPSVLGSVLSGVPRPMITFLGKIYFGNGNNIGEVDSTELITNHAKLSPALPAGLYVRDLDVSTDGNYLQIIASRTNAAYPLGDLNDRTSSGAADSLRFYWNGIDSAATAFENYSGAVLSTNVVKADQNFTFGHDPSGAALFLGTEKSLSLPNVSAPHPTAAFLSGNILGFGTTEYEESSTRFRTGIFNYGQYDEETPKGLFRLLRQSAQIRDDIISVSACIGVSNRLFAQEAFGYANNISGTAKLYYSTQEQPATYTTSLVQKLWRFETVPNGVGSVLAGVYETQNQLFSKKVKPGEIRFYTEPLVANNAFTLAILNSGSSIIAQNTYTVGTNVSAGDDLIRFKPEIAPTQAVGLRITNSGSANWTGLKAEIDWENAGT